MHISHFMGSSNAYTYKGPPPPLQHSQYFSIVYEWDRFPQVLLGQLYFPDIYMYNILSSSDYVRFSKCYFAVVFAQQIHWPFHSHQYCEGLQIFSLFVKYSVAVTGNQQLRTLLSFYKTFFPRASARGYK